MPDDSTGATGSPPPGPPAAPVDRAARQELAVVLERAWEGPAEGEEQTYVCPTSDDPAVREIFRTLLVSVSDQARADLQGQSPVRVRMFQRAQLFLTTDEPWPAETLGSKLATWFAGASVLSFLGGLVLFVIGAAMAQPEKPTHSAVAMTGFTIFVAGGAGLLIGALWLLITVARGGSASKTDPNEESPDECWPFESRTVYEKYR